MRQELFTKIDSAIRTLNAFNKDDEPYYLCYSGGKDSDCIRILADLAGVNYECHNNHTTVDAPETVYYIREVMQKYGERHEERLEDGTKCIVYGERGFIHLPKKTMWNLIEEKGVPTRFMRFCCSELKEHGGKGRRKITGVRWAESANRKQNYGRVTIIGSSTSTVSIADEIGANYEVNKKGGIILNTDNAESRRLVEMCYRTRSNLINPIIDWTDEDVWEFLRSQGCESNPLYKKGFRRIGCICCPLGGAKNMKKELSIWPTYRNAYVRAFDRMLEKTPKEKRERREKELGWIDGEHVMRWWVGDDQFQITIDDYLNDAMP